MHHSFYPERKRIRSANWNYAWSGCYHVTIITHNRVRWFGYVANKRMHFSPLGRAANELLHNLPMHHTDISVHQYVVMPDHVHLLLSLPFNKDQPIRVEDRFGPRPSNSLSIIINGYKGSVTRMARSMNLLFKWQYRFDARIVHDQTAFHAVQRYIVNNPANWRG